MKVPITKFIGIFLVSAFAFQFISNSLLGPEVRLFPQNGAFFPDADTTGSWKGSLAKIVYPVKMVLLGPLSSVFKGPDPAPPVLLVAFALYWSAIALVLHFLLSTIWMHKKGIT